MAILIPGLKKAQEEIEDQRHQWVQDPYALRLICERCGFSFAIKHLAQCGCGTNNEDDIYWGLCGNDLFSNGCCPPRIN